jgi:predicted transposase YdaD
VSKPFDSVLKDLVRQFPGDYLGAFIGSPPRRIAPVESDLSTLTAAADLVFKVGRRRLTHLELQSSPDARVEERILMYNAVLYYQHRLPVHSLLVLLRPKADRRNLRGAVHYRTPGGRTEMDFRFEVLRVWQRPMEWWLGAGTGTLPMAVLGAPPAGLSREAALPEAIRRMEDRCAREAPERAPELLTAAYILTGMYLPQEAIDHLFQGVTAMQESSTYRGLIRRGKMEGVRTIILRQGTQKFGTPSEEVKSAVEAIHSLPRLERLSDRILTADSWDELLATR